MAIDKNYKETENYLARLDEIRRVRKQKGESLLSEARAQKNLDKKADLYFQALDLDSSNIEVFFETSAALRDARRYRQAARVIEVLREAGLSDPRIPIALGEIYVLNKSYDRAIAILREGQTSGVASLERSYFLAKAYLGKKDYRQAESELAGVVGQSPDFKDASALLEECRKKNKQNPPLSQSKK
jgi:tetratricopeptide (TPR) repeat protein